MTSALLTGIVVYKSTVSRDAPRANGRRSAGPERRSGTGEGGSRLASASFEAFGALVHKILLKNRNGGEAKRTQLQ
ncbi:hypothetical protein EVAR_63713_1 [Eumeta japonica]|uniref:Uncharacterized protein n=1 Tax=Eumeta variegata TaxID=151549 RepID=A0A4C1ZYB4_EUMVA|nr:hypothetical protein EVAR_63713_1 [Eumeta japonica]